MKPLDPRLLGHARAARTYVAVVALTGATTATLVIAQVLLLARVLTPVIADRTTTLADVATPLTWLAVVLAARVAVHTAQEAIAHRAATRVVTELRGSVLTRALALGPRWRAVHGADTLTLAVRGLEDLEPYLVRYLPQLVLAATVTPATLAVVLGADLTSAVILAVTVPLIPVFMVLIGRLTQKYADERLEMMSRLGTQLLDLMAGLATLTALGREHGPAARIRQLGRSWSRATMRTLRLAFLSGAVLEFLSSICVALVAVSVGMRLVYGYVGLEEGLICIMLAPEVFRPLREVGTQYHASADGVAAAERAFAVLDAPLPDAGTAPAPDLTRTTLVLEDLTVTAGDRDRLAPAGLTAQIAPGRVTALVGPSGTGKTTTALVVLGVLAPDAGRVLLRGPDGAEVTLADVDPESWWEQVAFVPQRPTILPGSIAENLGGHARSAMVAAAATAGLDEVLADLPDGLDTVVGHGGVGLSVGQRQRLALTRALLSPAPLVVLDEPTAHLDSRAEEHVLRGVRALRDAGRTVLVVAHRPTLVQAADHVVEVASAPGGADRGGADRDGAGLGGADLAVAGARDGSQDPAADAVRAAGPSAPVDGRAS